jgi:GNAT superfamily N-acetyltransferase
MSISPTPSRAGILAADQHPAPQTGEHRALSLSPQGVDRFGSQHWHAGASWRDSPQLGVASSRTFPRHRLRLLNRDDVTELRRFHDRCSEETHYRRFLMAKPSLPAGEAERFCDLDQYHDGAFVAFDPGSPDRIRGVGRWSRINATTAEVAFVVEDEYQGRGIGQSLVSAVVARARSAGFTTLIADVLAENGVMRRLFRASGYPLVERYDGGSVCFSLDVSGQMAAAA